MGAEVLRRTRELARAEGRRAPGALWIVRRRSVPQTAFDSAARRILKGPAFGVACRVEDRRGRVLLVRPPVSRDPRRSWVTPGGGGRRGETPRRSVRREVREETGGSLLDLRLWKVYDEELRSPNGRRLYWIFLQYRARWKGGPLRPRDLREIADIRWFSRLPPKMAWREDWLLRPRELASRGGGSSEDPGRPLPAVVAQRGDRSSQLLHPPEQGHSR